MSTFLSVNVGLPRDRERLGTLIRTTIWNQAMLRSEAGEVMTAVEIAMLGNLPYQKLRDAIIAHLTTAEGLGALVANVPSRSER